MLREHLDAFLGGLEAGSLPAHVPKELRAFLGCGTFEQGAACFVCDACGQRVFLPFSCKTRGFCPSCCGRRMCDIAAHLVDRVLPDVPYRQWVLSVPVPVRFVVLRNRELVSKLLAVFLRVVSGHLRARARELGVVDGQVGSVAIEQRFGDGARLHWHVHALLPDGVFHRTEALGAADFVRVPAPERDELAQIVARLRVRVERLLRRAGHVQDPAEGSDEQPDLLSFWQAAALQGRIAVGPRAGWRVLRIGAQEVAVAPPAHGLCADAQGYNLHAGVQIPAGQRGRLEALMRYMLRPPLARDRLERQADGRVQVRLKRPYHDGTRALLFEPQDFIARLCAQVAPPRVHLVHDSGIFAPHASWRADVVPGPEPEEPATEPPSSSKSREMPPPRDQARARPRPGRLLWSDLMRRTFGLDVLACGCGGRLRLGWFIYDRSALAAIGQSIGRGRSPPAEARGSR